MLLKELSCVAGERVTWYKHLVRLIALHRKVEDVRNLQPSNSIPGYGF